MTTAKDYQKAFGLLDEELEAFEVFLKDKNQEYFISKGGDSGFQSFVKDKNTGELTFTRAKYTI